jgi:hypothetical protein
LTRLFMVRLKSLHWRKNVVMHEDISLSVFPAIYPHRSNGIKIPLTTFYRPPRILREAVVVVAVYERSVMRKYRNFTVRFKEWERHVATSSSDWACPVLKHLTFPFYHFGGA